MVQIKILFLLLLISFTSFSQVNVANKFILIDSQWGFSMKDSISTLNPANRYQFGTPIKTKLGNWVTPAINYLWFIFPDSCTVITLPNQYDSLNLAPVQTYSTN